ncbi:MAG: helix-hairpin-helix domain-containing protein, partial [Clostridia bacterium]|nr:helix-hairpin-helix domain-containing protein [Clostridia bacterium]
NWAVQNLDVFPVDVNTAPLETLLRIPGIGPKSAKRILSARREAYLSLHDLKRIGAVIRRAQYFIRTRDLPRGIRLSPERTIRALVDPNMLSYGTEQVSLLDPAARDGISPAIEEAVRCLAKNL